jgi:hypothetical protein
VEDENDPIGLRLDGVDGVEGNPLSQKGRGNEKEKQCEKQRCVLIGKWMHEKYGTP